MLYDSSNLNMATAPAPSLSHYSPREELLNTNQRNIDRILSAAIEEQKHRRTNGFITYNCVSLLDRSFNSSSEDDEEGRKNSYEEHEYLVHLNQQSTQRLEEEHKRFDLKCKKHTREHIESERVKKDRALSHIQRKQMKKASLKLVDLSNVKVQNKPSLSFSSSIRSSSTVTMSPSLSSPTVSNCAEDEDMENDENYCNDDILAVELEESTTFDEYDDEEYSPWDRFGIVQTGAFDEHDDETVSLELEGLPSPVNKESSIFRQVRTSQTMDGEMFQNRFMTTTTQTY